MSKPASKPAEPTNQPADRRRSGRAFLRMRVEVRAIPPDKPWLERTSTLVVSAHGALLTLATPVMCGQKLILRKLVSGEEQECQIVFLGKLYEGKTEVGVDFQAEAPNFWGLKFPSPQQQPVLD